MCGCLQRGPSRLLRALSRNPKSIPATLHVLSAVSSFEASFLTHLLLAYTLADVAKHKEPGDCWTAIEGLVYDISDYIGDHPGGPIALEAAVRALDSLSHLESLDVLF